MKKVIPILTEKSLALAQDGKYSFWVAPGFTKHQIRLLINELFDVDVKTVRTINYKSRVKTDFRRRKRTVKAKKKAIVTLGEKQKIDLFETKK